MKKRITIKVGSNVLTRKDGSLDVTRVSAIVDQIAALLSEGKEIILVTSGAVASGKSQLKGKLGDACEMDSVSSRQLFSAVGQARLMDRYYEFFSGYGIPVGQVLTVKDNFDTPLERENVKNCMDVMLKHGVIPIVNENDTVCLTELMFTDNDQLSVLISELMESDTLIILSNVDGLYNGNPSSPESSLIREIAPQDDIDRFICSAKSSAGRGGMGNKCGMARQAALAGLDVYIANGKRENIILDLIHNENEAVYTHFSNS